MFKITGKKFGNHLRRYKLQHFVSRIIILSVLILNWNALLTDAALETVNVNSGNYVILENQTIENVRIRLLNPNSSVVMEKGSTLRNGAVACDIVNHNTHGIIVTGDDVTLKSVTVSKCGGDAVHASNALQFKFWQGELSSKGAGISLFNVSNSEIFGVRISTRLDGIILQNSNDNQIVATVVYVSEGQRGFVLDADSHRNQLVRVRARHNGGTIQADAPDNLISHSVCGKRVGYVGCLSEFGEKEPENWGNPEDFKPRWRTACTPFSFQNSVCDYLTPQLAINASNEGERVVVDTNGQLGWGNITISKQGLMLLSNDLTQKGRYNFINYLDSLTVTAPFVHVQNFFVRSVPVLQPDTVLTSVIVESK